MKHEQVWVKVNTQVDRGIRSLIEALSAFPTIRTLESCEGTGDLAWVFFDCGEPNWEALSRLVLEVLGPPLIDQFGDKVHLNVSISEYGSYMAELTVRKAIIPDVSDAVKELLMGVEIA